jgi:uncharacterized protein YhbP (UPF0306 family)
MINMLQPQEIQEIDAFLAERRTLVLSTVGPSGEPACAPVYFNKQNTTSFDFVSKYESFHIENIRRCPSVAGAIYREGLQLSDICGLQIKGEVHYLESGSESEARERYMLRYPEIQANGYLRQMFMGTPMFRFKATWLRFCDHRDGVIRRREWDLI